MTVRATITNRGTRTAEEVVQLYIHDQTASLTRPVRELKGYRKIKLEPSQSQEVRFTLTRADLQFLGLDGRPTVEAGLFRLWVAPSAEAEGVSGGFTLTKG